MITEYLIYRRIKTMHNNRLSVMNSEDSTHGLARRPQAQPGLPRYSGPPRQQPAQRPQQHQPTGTGVSVQVNAYWAAAGKTPPSPVVKRTAHGKSTQQPPLYSDVQAAVAAYAQADGITGTTHYPVTGVVTVTRTGKGQLQPVLGADNVNFSANPIPATSQLNNVEQTSVMGTELAPVMNNSKPRKRSLWCLGTKPTQGTSHASA